MYGQYTGGFDTAMSSKVQLANTHSPDPSHLVSPSYTRKVPREEMKAYEENGRNEREE